MQIPGPLQNLLNQNLWATSKESAILTSMLYTPS